VHALIMFPRNAVRKAVLGMMAMRRMTALAGQGDPAKEDLTEKLAIYKEESEKEVMEVCICDHAFCLPHDGRRLPVFANCSYLCFLSTQDVSIVHHHNLEHPNSPSPSSALSSPNVNFQSLRARGEDEGEKAVAGTGSTERDVVVDAMASASLADQKGKQQDVADNGTTR
jgi:hypothetical protein